MILGSTESPHLAHILKRQTSKFQLKELRVSWRSSTPIWHQVQTSSKILCSKPSIKNKHPFSRWFFQRSIDQAKLASIWKEANVSPIFKKKGDKTNPTNYRSISLTCVLFKVLEHIVAPNISKHFTNQNIGTGSERSGPVRPSWSC